MRHEAATRSAVKIKEQPNDFLRQVHVCRRVNVRCSAAAVSGTEDGKRSRAAGEADTVAHILINSDVETIEERIIAI